MSIKSELDMEIRLFTRSFTTMISELGNGVGSGTDRSLWSTNIRVRYERKLGHPGDTSHH